MKKMVFLFLITLSNGWVFGQTAQQNLLSELLRNYYGIKDALTTGNTQATAAKANEYIRTANGIDYKVISEGNINALLKDATAISELADIGGQRRHFASLSSNMSIIAKAIKLSADPVYLFHCPVKKAGWLSPVREIQNPYDNTMVSCGEIIEVIKK